MGWAVCARGRWGGEGGTEVIGLIRSSLSVCAACCAIIAGCINLRRTSRTPVRRRGGAPCRARTIKPCRPALPPRPAITSHHHAITMPSPANYHRAGPPISCHLLHPRHVSLTRSLSPPTPFPWHPSIAGATLQAIAL